LSAPAIPTLAPGRAPARGRLPAGELASLAIRNLRGYPLRTFLTALGIVFGVASVIVMLALGEGAQKEILDQIGRMGIRNVIVNSIRPPESSSAQSRRRFIQRHGVTFQDLEQIRATIPTVAAALPVHSKSERAWYGSRRVDVTIQGVTPGHFERADLKVAMGRPLTAADEDSLAQVCVVPAALLRALGWYGPPLGFHLQCGDSLYAVVGVLEDEEFRGHYRKALETEYGGASVYIPWATMISREGTVSIKRGSGTFEATNIEVNQAIVECVSEDAVLPTARMITTVMEKFHEQKDWEVVVPLELLAQRQKAQRVFNAALVLIASISLLVGGIGIANITLATVTERTREIGVRRALGARRVHVLLQFLAETVVIAAGGGVLGIGVGVAGARALAAGTGWSTEVTGWSIAAAFGISCIVGVLSGMFPARRAARLDPIVALRYQ
jgi:putative ABC transport system permease protein